MKVPNIWHHNEELINKDSVALKLVDYDKVFVGCDSKYFRNYIIYAYAICYFGESGINYFWCREKVKGKKFSDLYTRIWGEVERSVNVANWINENCGISNIEVHADINSNPMYASNLYNSAAGGYITGCGYQYKCKPESWAATSVADWYTR